MSETLKSSNTVNKQSGEALLLHEAVKRPCFSRHNAED